MKRTLGLVWIVLAIFSMTSLAEAKTDVRALVSRPKDVSKRSERRCKADSDCVLIQCHAPCGFDDVANEKYVKKINARCEKAKKASGNHMTVDCAESNRTEVAKCRRKYCVLEEVRLPGTEPELAPPAKKN